MQLKCILLQKYLEIPCIDICLWTSEELSYRRVESGENEKALEMDGVEIYTKGLMDSVSQNHTLKMTKW